MASTTQPETSFSTTRRWHRFAFDVPVRVLLSAVSRKASELEFAGRGTGMNEGGIGIDVEAPLVIGSELQLEFKPPYAGLTLRVRGRVRNASGTCYGVEFLADDDAERQEVELFRRMLRDAASRLGQ